MGRGPRVPAHRPAPLTDPVSRGLAAARGLLRRQRDRRPWLDHLVHAGGRYNRVQGDLLASGVTYYVFLALFPVLLLAASVAGFVLQGNAVLEEQLIRGIREAVPGSTGEQLAEQASAAIDRAGTFGVIGLVGFLLVGLGAVDKLRVGMDVVWRGRPDPPDFLADRLKDLGALLGLGAAGVLSIALTTGATAASSWVLELLGVDGVPGYSLLTGSVAIALAVAGDVLVFLWLLKGVPDNPTPVRLLLPGAVFGAVGFEVLKLAGNWYLTRIGTSVTAQTLGGVVGLVVWINVVARFAFYTAAWTATIPAVEHPAGAGAATSSGPEQPLVPHPPDRARTSAPAPGRLAFGLLAVGALVGALVSRLLPRDGRREGRPPGAAPGAPRAPWPPR